MLTPDLPFAVEDALPSLTGEQVPVPPVRDTHLVPKMLQLRYLSGLKEIPLVELCCVLHRNRYEGNSCRPGYAAI